MKTQYLCTSIGALLLSHSLMAANLVSFSNGNAADANDVNSNFTELENRIRNLSANGVSGNATGIDFEPYKHQYASKSFTVTGRNVGWDTEKWDYVDNGGRELVITKSRTKNSVVVSSVIQTLSQGDNLDTIQTKEIYRLFPSICQQIGLLPVCRPYPIQPLITGELFKQVIIKLPGILPGFSNNTVVSTPGILLTKAHMLIGQPWNSSGTVTNSRSPGLIALAPVVTESLFIDTGVLLGIEAVNAGGQDYTDCLKIEHRRSGDFSVEHNFHKISWHCSGVGLVKEIQIIQQVSQVASIQDAALKLPFISNQSRVLEFIPQ